MNALETALKVHDWTLDGYKSRVNIDKLMKENTEQSNALWEQYCPWSVTNGGYIEWTKNANPSLRSKKTVQ
jgi:hypothetical protein